MRQGYAVPLSVRRREGKRYGGASGRVAADDPTEDPRTAQDTTCQSRQWLSSRIASAAAATFDSPRMLPVLLYQRISGARARYLRRFIA